MAETSHEIRRQIDDTRVRLGNTIAAIERKVDPHRVIEEHPLALVGVAFGTGVLLATTGATSRAVHEVRDQVQRGAESVNNKTGNAVDGVIDAIINAATLAIAGRLNDVLHVANGSLREESQRTTTGREARVRAA